MTAQSKASKPELENTRNYLYMLQFYFQNDRKISSQKVNQKVQRSISIFRL